MKKVAMIGVGKLGQDCAEVMSEHYDVVGYDIEPRTTTFPMMSTISEAVKDRDFIFIAAPTPHDPVYGGEAPTSHLPNKDFDYTIVTNILKEVNKYVNKSQLVILISTVLPGTVRSLLEPCITNARFIYNPYLIAMGTIKWDMVNPEMIIIGTEDGSTTGDAQDLIDFYQVFMNNNPRYEIGTWDEAESIKIFYNTFISTKLALVNMIQDVAEANGNIDVDIVTNALAKSNYRIMGPAYMKAGLGDAGACHPRDNIALRYLAEKLDLGYDLFDAIMKAREVQAERMALRCLQNGKKVTIVGKAYKPSVPYLHGSASLLIGHYIEKHGGEVRYYDLNTGDNDLFEDWTEVYLIGYWEHFVEKIRFPEHTVVIDPWRKIGIGSHNGETIHYGNSKKQNNINYIPDSVQLFHIMPELHNHQDKFHLIYAGVNMTTSFIRRPTEEIVKEIRHVISGGKTKIIFDCMTEDLQQAVVLKIHRLANLVKDIIKSEDLILLTGSAKIENAYDKIINKFKLENKITILETDFFHHVCKLGYAEAKNQNTIINTTKSKKFLCLNKVERFHRVMLLDYMIQNNLVELGYYSFQGSNNIKEQVQISNGFGYPNVLNYVDKLPLVLNITENRVNPVDLIQEDYKYFIDSYFSIITETVFFTDNENSIFLSEKIHKALAMGHPFILVSRPKSLEYLRSIGYKTFEPFINESYDNELNDIKRFELITTEIKRLCTLSVEELQVLYGNLVPIMTHNKSLFFERKSISNDTVNKLFN